MILDGGEMRHARKGDRWLAYALGTTFHETAFTMQPAHERGGKDYFFRMQEPGGPLPRRAALARSMGALAGPTPVLRCGWFQNPTPGNAWLTDRDGEWPVGVHGGHRAEGEWPKFPPCRRVRCQASCGHGCACLRVAADPKTQDIRRIVAAWSRPLAACRQDKRRPEPPTP